MKKTGLSVLNSRHTLTISDLLYSKIIFEEHEQSIEDTISFLTTRSASDWEMVLQEDEEDGGLRTVKNTATGCQILLDFELCL